MGGKRATGSQPNPTFCLPHCIQQCCNSAFYSLLGFLNNYCFRDNTVGGKVPTHSSFIYSPGSRVQQCSLYPYNWWLILKFELVRVTHSEACYSIYRSVGGRGRVGGEGGKEIERREGRREDLAH